MMDVLYAFLLILTIIPAVSYGWGMRGTTIGGEKGAMLPGAIIGLVIAMFSGVLIVREHFYIFAALGAVSMYFGGSMTYGETLGISMNSRPAENMKKGLIALFIKGFLWFGCFGVIFTTGINAVCHVYSLKELLIIFGITPLSAVGLYFIFNKPLKPAENKFPKIYFSKKRQESWGALLGAFLTLFIFAIIKSNFFTIVFSLSCALFGGLGWVLGQLLQIYSIHYADSSKSYFGRLLGKSNNVDSWKIMECVLGAFGGWGAAIGFISTYDIFKKTVFTLEKNGGLLPFNETFSKIAFIVWLVLIALDLIHYFIKKPQTKTQLKTKLKTKEITQEQYSAQLLKAVDSVPKCYDIYYKITEIIEPVLYAALPFILICLGCEKASVTVSFFLLFFVLCQEIALEKVITPKSSLVLKIILGIVCATLLILQLTVESIFNENVTLILYTVIYEVLTLGWLVPQLILNSSENGDKEVNLKDKIVNWYNIVRNSKSFLKVHGYFIICIALTLIILL